jgi:hypothetical protein
LAVALALYHLGSRSLWFDEVVTENISRSPNLGRVLSDGGNMAVYYLLMKPWLLLGHGEWVARLPSAVSGGTAALLLAVNASVVRFGQNARSYNLELFLVTASWMAMAIALERRTVRWFLIYGVVAGLAVDTQILASLFVVTQLATLVLLPKGTVPWRRLAAGMAVAAAMIVPVLVAAVQKGSHQIKGVNPLTIREVNNVLAFVVGSSASLGTARLTVAVYVLGWLGAVVVIVRLVRLQGRSRDTWAHGAALAWLVLPFAMALAISPVQSVMVPRYFIGLVPAAVLVLALAVTRIPRRNSTVVATAVLVSIAAVGVSRSYSTDPANWKSVTRFVLSSSTPADALVIMPSADWIVFKYYWEQQGRPALPLHISTSRNNHGASDAPRQASAHRRIWLIVSNGLNGAANLKRPTMTRVSVVKQGGVVRFIGRLRPWHRIVYQRFSPNLVVLLLETG